MWYMHEAELCIHSSSICLFRWTAMTHNKTSTVLRSCQWLPVKQRRTAFKTIITCTWIEKAILSPVQSNRSESHCYLLEWRWMPALKSKWKGWQQQRQNLTVILWHSRTRLKTQLGQYSGDLDINIKLHKIMINRQHRILDHVVS